MSSFTDKEIKEIEKYEKEYAEKERKKEYYREQDKKRDERLAKLENQVVRIADGFDNISALLEKAIKTNQKDNSDDGVDAFTYSIRQLQLEKQKERERQEFDIEYIGDLEYHLFCAWCNAYRAVLVPGTNGQIDMDKMKETSYVNEQFFKEYCDKELKGGSFNRKIPDFQIKKYIAEKYFGYEYTYDHKSEKWSAVKKKVS